jgi:hypothetical protein
MVVGKVGDQEMALLCICDFSKRMSDSKKTDCSVERVKRKDGPA